MAGLTTTESQATLDARFPTTGATDHVAYSANGTTEFSGMENAPKPGEPDTETVAGQPKKAPESTDGEQSKHDQ